MMHKYPKLPGLIGDIYDAALKPANWTDVLANIAEFVGGRACGILSINSSRKFQSTYYHFGIDPAYLKSYSKTYWEFDPLDSLFLHDVEQVVSFPDLVPYNEFRRGRFFQEWIKPQGWVDAAKVVLEKSETSYVCVSVMRGEDQGMVDDEMRRRIALLVPHLKRALLIGKVVDLKRIEADTFAHTIDGLNAGMFLVGADGHIVHANTAGQSILNEDDFLQSSGGRLVARDTEIDQTMREFFTAADDSKSGVDVKGVALPLKARNGERYIAHILPLASGAKRRVGIAHNAIATLFVRKAALEISTSFEVIGKSYELTAAELRVLHAIVEVSGTREVATALGLADNTVKTHLRHLFEKTGTGRQAELVKLVAGFSSPLVNSPSQAMDRLANSREATVKAILKQVA